MRARGDALGREDEDETDDRHDDGALRAAFPDPLSLGALRHEHDARPDDGEDGQAGGGVGHRREDLVEGFEHCPLLIRRRAHREERDAGEKQGGQAAPQHGYCPLRTPRSHCSSSGVTAVWVDSGGSSSGSGGTSGS